MLYHILALGDVTSESAVDHLQKHLPAFKRNKDVCFTVINGENVSGVGLTPHQAELLFAAGADVITLGNHTWGKRQIGDYLDENRYILRPANFSPRTPGRGWGVYECGRISIGVMNLIGRCNLDWKAADPFATADRLLAQGDRPTFTLVDFHAEATSEKLALAYYLDGRVSALWGTHTHVPTADERVFPKGTGYITDLGMTGSVESVLGIRPEQSVDFFLGGLSGRFQASEGPCKAQGCLFTLDDATGMCTAVERVDIR
ncbi:MAG: YmdB family metallophosphoesterase [Oscillospiraceae bacterium]|nr:YmdB family metallophosphoesterase [Oscillospiraceae bacterium]